MKKLVSTLFMIVVSLSLSAQIEWNVKAGVGMSNLASMDKMTGIFSYKAGIGMDIPLHKHWAIQPTLYYSQKGAKFEANYGGEQIYEGEFKYRLHYLELPILAAYKIKVEQNAILILKAGPYLATGLSAKCSVKTPTYNDFHQTFKENLFAEEGNYDEISYINGEHTPLSTKKFRRLDMGIEAGVDLLVNHFMIGVEIAFGLTPLSNNLMNKKPKNIAGYLMFGYQF